VIDGSDLAHPIGIQTEFGRPAQFHRGLTKRELFAAMAMQAIASVGDTWPREDDFREIARRSVMSADALIAELSK
jgi:hypothetical protein